jgi:37-kD nucleoid-associated bacterial protein
LLTPEDQQRKQVADISSVRVDSLIVHRVGNKIRDEGYHLSNALAPINGELSDLLIRHYLAPTLSNGAVYGFHHDSDINLNEIRHFSGSIFADRDTFAECSQSIAKHLYSSSTHPNVGGGELIIVLFDNIQTDFGAEQGLGLFRIEAKDDFLDIEENGASFSLVERTGISVQRIQKGALVLSGDGRIHAVDSLSQKTKYWIDTFLQAKPQETPIVRAKAIGAFIKAVSNKVTVPAQALEFGKKIQDHISRDETATIGEIKEISSKYLEAAEVNSILAGIGGRIGLPIADDFSADQKQLFRYTRDVIRKSRIAEGINIVISNQDAKVSTVEVKKTNTGIRATIDIQISEGER